jgi:ArsR family transcriptional regulator
MDLESKAQLLRVIAHPTRLKIIERLAAEAEPLCVSDLEPDLGIPQPNVSQHLAVLRKTGVVDFYVDGRLRCYFLKDPRIAELVAVLDQDVVTEPPSPTCCTAKVP